MPMLSPWPVACWLLLAALPVAVACASGSTTPTTPGSAGNPAPATAPQAALGTAYQQGGLQESALALYILQLDPVSLTATSTLKAVRQGQANDDLYLLSIGNFLRPDSFRIRSVTRNGGTLEVGYQITHPFPAPDNPTGTPNGFSNRSDLGIAGRVLFLADAAASGNTYFTDRIANTALVTNADGYYSPEDLITYAGTANLFPFRQLVDESGPDGSRVGISNGGDPTGNFGADGWTRAKYGPGNNGWTGYGVLHQGQAAAGMVAFDLAVLGGGLDLNVAFIAKYNDPRGGQTAGQKRGNRLPGAAADHTQFAYRMPHGALDIAALTFAGDNGPGFLDAGVSGTELEFTVIDWDANATPSPQPAGELQDDPIVTNVEAAETGSPALSVCIPGVLGDATVTADIAEDGASGSGLPGDPLIFRDTVTKLNPNTAGTYTGMARAIDPEDGALLPVPLDQGTPPLPLGPGTTPPRPVVYQAFAVQVNAANAAPTASYAITMPMVPNGGSVSLVVTGLADADSDDVEIWVDWDDDGTYTLAHTENAPYAGSIPLSSPITYTHSPPAPDTRDLPVRITDGIAIVDLAPVETFEVLPETGWVYTPLVSSTALEQVLSLDVDPAGNVIVAGQRANTASGLDFGGGPRAVVSTQVQHWVLKLDSAGQYLWDRVWGQTGTVGRMWSVAADADGNVYVYGLFAMTMELNHLGGGATDQVSGGGTGDIYILKFDPAGAFLGMTRTNDTVASLNQSSLSNHILIGSAISAGPNSRCMVIDRATGTIFITGPLSSIGGTVNFGSGVTVVTPSGVMSPLVKYNTSLIPQWAVDLDAVSAMGNTQYAQNIVLNPVTGDPIIGGSFIGTVDFGGGPVTGSGTFNHIWFASRTATTGAYVPGSQRVFVPSVENTMYLGGMAADSANLYLTGYWGGAIGQTLNIGSPVPAATATVANPTFLAAYTLSNVPLWVRLSTGSGLDLGTGVGVAGGALYTAAYSNAASSNFGYGALATVGSWDVYMPKYAAADGATSFYQRRWGSTAGDVVSALAMTSTGNPILGGAWGGVGSIVDWDPGPGVVNRTSTGGGDIFVVKLIGATGEF